MYSPSVEKRMRLTPLSHISTWTVLARIISYTFQDHIAEVLDVGKYIIFGAFEEVLCEGLVYESLLTGEK